MRGELLVDATIASYLRMNGTTRSNTLSKNESLSVISMTAGVMKCSLMRMRRANEPNVATDFSAMYQTRMLSQMMQQKLASHQPYKTSETKALQGLTFASVGTRGDRRASE